MYFLWTGLPITNAFPTLTGDNLGLLRNTSTDAAAAIINDDDDDNNNNRQQQRNCDQPCDGGFGGG